MHLSSKPLLFFFCSRPCQRAVRELLQPGWPRNTCVSFIFFRTCHWLRHKDAPLSAAEDKAQSVTCASPAPSKAKMRVNTSALRITLRDSRRQTILEKRRLGSLQWGCGGAAKWHRMAEANAGESPASASSTSSSDELKSSSSEDSVSAPGLVLFHEEKHSSSDEGFDRFADLCNGQRDRGSTVHFWTIPHSDGAGRLTAENTSRKAMMRHFRAVYGDNVSYWAIFRELHAASGTAWERKPHYHIVLRLTGRVRGIRIAQELRQRCIYAHLSVPTRYADFWRAFAYCWVPSVRKPMSELDQEPLTSKNFPMEEAQKKLRARLARSQVVRPWDLFQVVSKNPSIQEYADLVLWAQEQQRRGVTQYMAYMVKQGSKMPGLFKSWKQLVARPSSQRTLREERLRIWSEARQKPCTCTTPNRLKLGLAALLEHHNKDGARLAYFIQRLVRIGTAAKNSNIIIFGASNAGKTCLTRPLISLFRHRAWLRPNKGDTFPLEGLQDYLVACWQDWRRGHGLDFVRHSCSLILFCSRLEGLGQRRSLGTPCSCSWREKQSLQPARVQRLWLWRRLRHLLSLARSVLFH